MASSSARPPGAAARAAPRADARAVPLRAAGRSLEAYRRRGRTASTSSGSSRASACRSSSRRSCARTRPGFACARRRGRATPGRRAAGVFVGRVHELAELKAGLDDALAGRGRLFLVSGESGVGKTRLADELASRAKDSASHPLGSLVEGRRRSRVLAVAPGPPQPRGASRHRRPLRAVRPCRRAAAWVGSACATCARRRSMPPTRRSLELLGDVAGRSRSCRSLLVATYSEGADLPAALAVSAPRRAPPAAPGAADVDEVDEFLRGTGRRATPAVHADTGGNPRASSGNAFAETRRRRAFRRAPSSPRRSEVHDVRVAVARCLSVTSGARSRAEAPGRGRRPPITASSKPVVTGARRQRLARAPGRAS